MRAAGIDSSPEKLPDLAVETILAAQETAAAEMAAMGSMPWHPVVDGDFLPEAPRTAIAGGAACDIPVIIGTTSEELRLFIDPSLATMPFDDMVGVLQLVLTPQLGGDPGADAMRALLTMYRDSKPDGADIFTSVVTDASMRAPALQLSDALSTRGPTYAYSFEWPAPRVGSCHALDIPFTFGTLDRFGWDEFAGAVDNPEAEQLSAAIMQAWAALARTGDPSAAGVGEWPRYDRAARMTMILGPTRAAVEHPVAPVLDAHIALRKAASGRG
jgi:para-nitrobenzyl esterase